MIFYFSGTGNSLYVAKNIAYHNNEELVSIAAEENNRNKFNEYTLRGDEILGFVYPVYAWGPPKIVLEFIEKLKLNNYQGNYVFTVTTCGGSTGNTIKVIEACLKQKGIPLRSGFSLKMPNNYIIMGDVDSKELEKEKLSKVDENLKYYNDVIQRKAEEFRVEKGSLPWLLTGFINPMFNKNPVDTAKFHVNTHCTGCGICEKICNCNNIKVSKKPQWGQRCTQCLACIHYCPAEAIQYGKVTVKKGRYTNPNLSIDEILKRK